MGHRRISEDAKMKGGENMTTDQRITALEKEVAELKVMISKQPEIIRNEILKSLHEANQQFSVS